MKGFTLIELLAVIVIMGILMVVAIPAVSRTITNTRKDTYLNTAKQYVNQVKTLWAADGLLCDDTNSSVTSAGTYYVEINSAEDQLLEEGGTSPWKNNTKGYVKVVRNLKTGTSNEFENVYSVFITDTAGNRIGKSDTPVQFDRLTRSDVSLDSSEAGYTYDHTDTETCKVQ